MEQETKYFAEAAMLIRRPIAMVFEAFTNPEVTTKIWFTKSSGRVEQGKSIDWTWEMFNHTVSIKVKLVVPNEQIIIQWGNDPDAIVEWVFQSFGDEKTFVTVKNTGFKGKTDELIAQVRDATGGFTLVLAGAKALVEHGIELNLIADRYPKK